MLTGARLLLVPLALCLLAAGASAQKRPKPALKEKDARRAVAAAPGFALKTGAVKVREVSPAGAEPVRVAADVTVAVRFESVEDERAPQTGGAFKAKRRRAVEFRTGDRSWEEFDFVSTPAVESARRALEALVTEFEAQQAAVADKGEAAGPKEGDAAAAAEDSGAKKDKKKGKKKEERRKAPEPLTRGPLTVRQLSPMGSSAVAEVVVAADFTLARDARGRWRVAEVSAGGGSSGDLAALWLAADARKAERARAELAGLASALEAFRRERGFYVVARDSVVLLDHLSPRYAKRVVRLDPWHNPYRYEGGASAFTLASDGPDGKHGTADDVTLAR